MSALVGGVIEHQTVGELARFARSLFGFQLIHPLAGRKEPDAFCVILDSLNTDGLCQMRLAGARATDKHDVLGEFAELDGVEFAIRTLIPAVLHEVKSYDLPRACTQLGIRPSVGPGDETEAHASKRSYVITRIADLSEDELVELARKVLLKYPDESLMEALVELTVHSQHRVSRLVRGDVLKVLNRFGTCSQFRFFALLEKLVHPMTRRDAEQAELVSAINDALKRDGFTLKQTAVESGYAIYGVVRVHVGPSSGMLLWSDLRDWYAGIHGVDKTEASRILYARLRDSVIGTNSAGEYAIFHGYYKRFSKLLDDRLPALIPQVYLHYDPYTRRERGDENSWRGSAWTSFSCLSKASASLLR
jgi:hypothetical protein